MIKEKSLKKNSFYSILKAIATLIFPIITFPYASRILMPDGIGKVNFANSIVSYFTMLAGLGLGTYGTREVSEARNNEIKLSKIVKELLVINIISTIISYSFFLISIVFIKKLILYRPLLLISSINIIFSTLGIEWYYRGTEEFRYITFHSFCFQLVALAFLFIFVHKKEDTIQYLLFGIISSVGSNALNIIHARKIIFAPSDKLNIKRHIKPILIFFGIAISVSIYTMLDTSMVGFLANDKEVGYYVAANKLNRMVISIIVAAISILLPRLSFYHKQNDIEKFLNLANKSLRYIFIVSIPCAVGLYMLGKPTIILFSGTEYLPAVSSMKIMTPNVFNISLGVFINVHILVSIKKKNWIDSNSNRSRCQFYIKSFVNSKIWSKRSCCWNRYCRDMYYIF
ncbi:flippase [Treponema socranskii]|uniref:flippase n=1 Tax=Treponema socranskii TaxID=53419 RepID=UPI003D6F9700